jgi:hypothetical protein
MALARLITRAIVGVESPPVTVEVHLSGGLPSMTIVGYISPNFLTARVENLCALKCCV